MYIRLKRSKCTHTLKQLVSALGVGEKKFEMLKKTHSRNDTFIDSFKVTAKSGLCEIYRRPNIIGYRPPSTILRYFHRYFYGMLINRCRLNPSWMLNIEHSRPYMRMHINFGLFFMSPSAERNYRLYSVHLFFVLFNINIADLT